MAPRLYPVAALREAVAATHSMNDLLTHLAIDITPGKRAAMWARLSQHGLDTGHWVRSPHARRLYTDDALRRAVAASESVAGVMRLLGMKMAGGSHAHIRRRIDEAGIDTSHFLGQAVNRGRPGRRRSAEDVLRRLPPGSRRPKGSLLARAMLESGIALRCSGCGIGPVWNESELHLPVDHIDGDWLNNLLGNLRFLCPNCHSQTATWCRRKGS